VGDVSSTMETYVVQIWIPSEEEGSRGDLRGFVEHVGSGRREPFRNSGEFLAFFEALQATQPQEVER
jgi:hypothetical protein